MYFFNTAIAQFVTVTTSSVIVSTLVCLFLGALSGSLMTYKIMKRTALRQQWQQQVDGNYDVVANLGAINHSFEMEGNAAYGPLKPVSMEDNVAYRPVRNRQ